VFGVVSLLLDVAAAITAVAEPLDDLQERRQSDDDDSDEAIGCYPLVDVVEEEDELLVLVEIPGFYSADVQFKVREDILILADSQDHEFHEILLPEGYDLDEPASIHFNNGITTIKYPKALVPCSQRRIA
jgi:HSP20 family molecular chaperone IbpA